VFLFFGISLSTAQRAEIYLNNPSFEDTPRKGVNTFLSIRGWNDCGLIYFRNETPPDIHPHDFWEVTKSPSDGNTYLGMVVRDNESWEFVSQRLSEDVKAGVCYKFSIDLARSRRYVSATRKDDSILENFTQPAVLRIWGGNNSCSKNELIAESKPIANIDWRTYNFVLRPNKEYRYIILEAFYKTPVLIPYNGHILLDNGSSLIEIPCDEDVPEEEEIVEKVEEVMAKPTPIVKKPVEPEPNEEIVEEAKPSKEKILQELDSDKLVEGQTIKIEKLYFSADATAIGTESFEVLEEIYDFLSRNDKIVVEIGGHTNGLPKHDYCDNLSSVRAKEVALYLVRKGIPTKRIKYKGYGKRKPIASNLTKSGRKKNQRVEIKILSLNG
jgi:outer membrane protein OmpA-like peptidoglycan-associated protein